MKLKVKKGDLVQMLTGKDRGKQGRVLEVRKDDRRVIVENLNMVKRHSAPEADEGSEPDGRAAGDPGRDHREGVRRGRLERDGRLPGLQPPTRVGMTEKEAKGGSIHVRVCKRADCGQEIDR